MKKNKSIIGSSIMVIAVMLGSKFLGFIRQTVIAAYYGSDVNTDIYFVSSDFMIGLSGALLSSLTTALITIYIDVAVKKNRACANKIASKMLTLFLMASGVFIILINLFAPYVAKFLAPSYTGETLSRLILYLRIFSVTFVFTAFQSIYAAVLNANQSFVPGKLYGIVYNPIAIFMVLLFSVQLGTKALVIAYFLGNIIQTLLLRFFCSRTFNFKPSIEFDDENIKKLIWMSLPLLVSNIFIQLNSIIDKSICSFLGEGFASNYLYAYTLEQFISATITATLSLILLSQYATYVSENNTEMVIKTFKESLSGLLIILAPITAVVCSLSYDIVCIVYLRNQYTQADAIQTSYALIGFGFGFALLAFREMYMRLHFSYQDTKFPMIANILSVAINAVLSIILAKYIGIFGISFATSISVIFAIILLNKSVKKYIPSFKLSTMLPLMIKVLISCIAAFAASQLVKNIAPDVLYIRFILSASAAGIVYLICLYVLKCRELYDLVNNVMTKIAYKIKKKH